ncbi:MAG TPA: exonuclease domain-containing protein [Micromonosporaceae bacterium]
MYAVIDLETTGLNPLRHDRIAEIAIVHLDADGEITGEWCTLVNPQRDLGPQRIHGIRAADARRAPTFAQLAPQIADLLRGRVLVAHNVAFDGPFLAHQFQQIGAHAPIDVADALCTMQLAAGFLPTSGRSLAACCATAGVRLDNAHCALDDARASALLLAFYLRVAGMPPPWAAQLATAAAAAWPELPHRHLDEVRRPTTDAAPPHFLSRLVDRLPRVAEPVQADSYLALLDRALVDRRISATETDALVTAATSMKLGRADVVALHTDYLAELASAALDDGVISDEERADLVAVAGLLGLPATIVDDAESARYRVPRQRWRLEPGDEIVFTGDSIEPREIWERRAIEAGLTVAAAVTTGTRLLVAADVDTMSVKARRASVYGIPIVDMETFLEMVRKRSG